MSAGEIAVLVASIACVGAVLVLLVAIAGLRRETRTFANPVVKVLAVRAGAATGIRRLAGSDTDHPAALRNGQNGHNSRNGHNGNGR
jgi:hypothetical protein